MNSNMSYSLSYDDFNTNMMGGMRELLETGNLADVTLAIDGQMLKAHKTVLSMYSPYFNTLFASNPNPHPIFFMRNVKFHIVRDLLAFMYLGKAQICEQDLNEFVETATSLQVKGLSGAAPEMAKNADSAMAALTTATTSVRSCNGETAPPAKVYEVHHEPHSPGDVPSTSIAKRGKAEEDGLVSKRVKLHENIAVGQMAQVGGVLEAGVSTMATMEQSFERKPNVNVNTLLNESAMSTSDNKSARDLVPFDETIELDDEEDDDTAPIKLEYSALGDTMSPDAMMLQQELAQEEGEPVSVTFFTGSGRPRLQVHAHTYYEYRRCPGWGMWRCIRYRNGNVGYTCNARLRVTWDRRISFAGVHDHAPPDAGAARYTSRTTEILLVCRRPISRAPSRGGFLAGRAGVAPLAPPTTDEDRKATSFFRSLQ